MGIENHTTVLKSRTKISDIKDIGSPKNGNFDGNIKEISVSVKFQKKIIEIWKRKKNLGLLSLSPVQPSWIRIQVAFYEISSRFR